jgi:hypothetical protein
MLNIPSFAFELVPECVDPSDHQGDTCQIHSTTFQLGCQTFQAFSKELNHEAVPSQNGFGIPFGVGTVQWLKQFATAFGNVAP